MFSDRHARSNGNVCERTALNGFLLYNSVHVTPICALGLVPTWSNKFKAAKRKNTSVRTRTEARGQKRGTDLAWDARSKEEQRAGRRMVKQNKRLHVEDF